MFSLGIRKPIQADTSPSAIEKIPPKPSRLRLIAKEEPPELSDYETLAESIGFHIPSSFKQQRKRNELIKWFNANEITIYDGEEVHKYMSAIAIKAGKHYCWCPLRGKDRFDIFPTSIPMGMGNKSNSLYNRLVPKEVLLIVKKIHDHFGYDARFEVTDMFVPTPDPFMRVSIHGEVFVFAVWDEPGFSMKKEDESQH